MKATTEFMGGGGNSWHHEINEAANNYHIGIKLPVY